MVKGPNFLNKDERGPEDGQTSPAVREHYDHLLTLVRVAGTVST